MSPSLDHFMRTLTGPVSEPVPMRVGVFGRRGRIRGLTVRELLDLADRHPDSRRTVWRLFRLMSGDAGDADVSAVRMLFDAVQFALGSRSAVTRIRLARLPFDVFDAVVQRMVDLTVPDPERTDSLFRPRTDEGERRPPQVGTWTDPAVALPRVADALALRGADDPMAWTPGRLLFVSSQVGERDADLERIRTANVAFATRLAPAKDQTFRSEIAKLVRDL